MPVLKKRKTWKNTLQLFMKTLTNVICICSKRFIHIGFLNQHILKMHEGVESIIDKDQITFQCSICCSIFAHKHLLEQQVSTVHEGHKPYKCDICLSFFTKKISLKSHIEAVHERKFDCVICGSHFSKERHLHEHYEQAHESKKQRKEKTLHCPNPKCNAKFNDRLLLVIRQSMKEKTRVRRQ